MRWKIITINGGIIILLGLFLYALLRIQLTDLVSNEARIQADAMRVVSAANAQLQLDALRVERWLSEQALSPSLREPFLASIANARAEGATEQCNRIQAAAAQTPALTTTPPAIVALVDVNGVTLGRNGSNLMRGEDLGKAHPKMKETIAAGGTGSSIWYNPQQSQQWFVSYAPIRDAVGKIVGGVLYGTPLNDERLTRTTDKTSGGAIVVGIPSPRGLEAVAKSRTVPPEVASSITQDPLAANILASLKRDNASLVAGGPADWIIIANELGGYGGEQQAVLLAVAPARMADFGGLTAAIAGMVALGLVLVSISGVLLGNYISKPIEELEEGLLQILNGRTELRFELEHAVLGGLVFRINTLLNQLMGVQEDDTDEDGRPSLAPSAKAFGGALEVDENSTAGAEQVDANVAAALAAEPAAAYYRRIYQEYIQAKRTIGDPTDHITEASFVERIQQREQEMATRIGRPVRYQVQLRGKEVVLIAVQIG